MSVPLPIGDVAVNFVPAKAGEMLVLGPMQMRIMEDGSNTGILISYNSRNLECTYSI